MSMNLIRSHFKAYETVITPQSSDQQFVANTRLFKIGDYVDVVDVDLNGNITAVLAAGLTILGIIANAELALSASVDTTAAVGTPTIVNKTIMSGQAAIERLYKSTVTVNASFDLTQAILAKGLNEPSAGKTTYDIDDASFWKAGDLADIFDDNGLVASDVSIESVNVNADASSNRSTIVITTLVDVTLLDNPYLVNKTINAQKAIIRNQERIDEIDRPVKNEYNGVGNGASTCFKTTNLFVKDTTDFYLDGTKLRLGTPGTRAALTQGAGDSQLLFTSMLLGLLGNEIRVRVIAGAGLTISVVEDFKVNGAGSFAASDYLIQINDNGGAATSQEIANALNAHAVVQRIIQVRYGGDGTGVVAAFGPTSLTGGLNDGLGMYAELEQIFENVITNTGYRFASMHIRPLDDNKPVQPPLNNEDIIFGYSRARDNIDR